MDRRNFLKRVSAGAVLAGAADRLVAATSGPLKRMGVTSWSLHNYFPKTRYDAPAGTPTIKMLEFFPLIVEKFGVRNFELVNSHFDATDAAYCTEVKQAVAKQDGKLYNICVDIAKTNLSDDNEEHRKASVEAVKKWIDIAALVGSPSIRCNTGQSPRGNAVDKTIASYKELVAYSAPKKIRVIIENHGGVSYVPEKIVEIMKGVGGPWIGTLPDMGNWPSEEVRYRGLEMVFPYGKMCHVKTLGSAEGTEGKPFDLARCVKIAEKSGFKGIYSMEYEGPEDPMVAIPRMMEVVKANIG